MPNRPPYVFISYRHESNTTGVATQFYDQLRMYRQGFGIDGIFMDKDKLTAGDVWRDEVQAALERTTHFVVMLTNGYWLSDECHRELAFAVDRYHSGGPAALRLLFVQVQQIAPELLAFEQPAAEANAAFINAQLGKAYPQLKTVGDLQFLGPFNQHAQLIRLPPENDPLLGDALYQLMIRLKATLPAKG